MINWPDRLTSADIFRIEKHAHVRLFDAWNPDAAEGETATAENNKLAVWDDLLRHPSVMINVLRWWCNVSDDEFEAWSGDLDGSSGKAGVAALENALAVFFSDMIPTTEGLLFGATTAKAREWAEAERPEVEKRIRDLDADTALRIIAENSGGLPELPGSPAPAPTHGGS